MKELHVEFEREQDGRWIADITDVPGALAYGKTREEALAKAEAIALRALASELETTHTSRSRASVSTV
jgi:predicted RNase H-like HicB family nuclease